MFAKVCLVGPKGAGKSTLASKFDKNAFSELLKGIAFVNWNMAIGKYKVDLQIWETCGEDRFRCMGPIFYKATNAAICMFDITSKQSFLDMQAWVTCVQRSAEDECVYVLLGNKIDLQENREVTAKEAQKYAESVGASYFEICALSGEGVTEAFRHIARCLLRLNDCYNSYHAKLAIASSSFGFCSQEQRRHKKWKPKHASCLACLHIR